MSTKFGVAQTPNVLVEVQKAGQLFSVFRKTSKGNKGFCNFECLGIVDAAILAGIRMPGLGMLRRSAARVVRRHTRSTGAQSDGCHALRGR
jgi:hypothetical protein